MGGRIERVEDLLDVGKLGLVMFDRDGWSLAAVSRRRVIAALMKQVRGVVLLLPVLHHEFRLHVRGHLMMVVDRWSARMACRRVAVSWSPDYPVAARCSDRAVTLQ
jgi:hypothetical protein